MACVELMQMDASQGRDDKRWHERRLSDGHRDRRVQACLHDDGSSINGAKKVLAAVDVASPKPGAAITAQQERALLAASRHLSNYIRLSLQEERSPVWIAQREGRAKDGIDRTEPAVIKMLAMSRDKQTESFSDLINALGIVPVSIAYELDPCDGMKAREMYLRSTTGTYAKAEQEDVASIAAGISGQKGRVHVAFGTPLVGEFDGPDAVAAEIDRQIISLYCLHPTNLQAWQMLQGPGAAVPETLTREAGSCSDAQFRARIESLPEEQRRFALATYANAVAGKLALRAATEPPASC